MAGALVELDLLWLLWQPRRICREQIGESTSSAVPWINSIGRGATSGARSAPYVWLDIGTTA
ncbi:MAG: hypothetical protein H0T11_07090 [Chthoniobacterales bacterium]|nr:hypothetical protein [Chthoniobacterales bacterium]